MATIINSSTPKAKKDYICNAIEWVVNSDCWCDLTFTEKKEMVKAKRNKWKIKKGQVYYKQVGIWNGDFGVFRAIPSIDNICQRLELYQED